MMSRYWPPASIFPLGTIATNRVAAARRRIPEIFASLNFCLVLASLLLLSGCASVQVHLGMKVYLDKTPVQSMQVSVPKGPAIGPGQKLPLVVVLTEPNGKILQTEGAGSGKVMWKELKVTATVVAVNQKGIVSLSRDPRVSDGKVPHVTVTVPSHPDLRANLDIPVRYDEKYMADFSGSSGFNGNNGMDGTSGMSGSSGSMDPNNPSAGGDGGNGSDGSNGGDGGNGGDAPPVQVRVAFRSGAHPLLAVSVSAAGASAKGHEKLYLLDLQGGSLTVTANGGSGGRGGSGGMGTPSGNSGRDGSDGRSGSDGSPGRAGSITVTYDPQAKPFLAAIRLVNQGGPRPVFKEEGVGPLW